MSTTDRRFDLFVVLAEMRTGSNLLEEQLNRLDGVHCAGELFNPRFIGHPKTETVLGHDLGSRERDPMGLVAALRAQPGLNGFRYFHDHDPRVIDPLLADPRCAKIVLTRNPLDSYISRKIAAVTNQWKLGDVKRKRAARVAFDALEFETHVATLQAFQLRVLRALQVSGQTAFHIGYDDLGAVEVLNGLAAWLGVSARLAEVSGKLKPQNPEPPEAKLTNPEALAPGLARLDRFDLSRTPDFEPRRGPRLGTWRRAARAPVLFMPVPGGRDRPVLDWLAALDGGARADLPAPLDPRGLRDWLEAHPRRCCFAVIRHPLERAHDVFAHEVLTGRRSGVRAYLQRVHGLSLPPPEAAAQGLDAARHRAAFLAFLAFVRANLAGQTGLPVQPPWASQSRFVQGFSAQCVPDRVVRADALPEALARIAADLGDALCGAAPPFRPAVARGPLALADICDATVQAAGRAAYAADYRLLGFGDWRATDRAG
ncbi:MAG: nodulation protein NodH [Rhodobacteraceae bacterium]|nr:nodulation protein NodH [Paracoccaceae bacterium]